MLIRDTESWSVRLVIVSVAVCMCTCVLYESLEIRDLFFGSICSFLLTGLLDYEPIENRKDPLSNVYTF